MNTPASPQHIRNLLQQQYETAGRLSRILEQEYAALTGNNLQYLETILADKQYCTAQFEETSRDFLAEITQSSKERKFEISAFLRRCDPEQQWGLEFLWSQVEQLISLSRQKNDVNGKIVSLNYRRIQQALSILRHGEHGSESCYDLSGTNRSAVSSRILGKV